METTAAAGPATSPDDLVEDAVALARTWLAATADGQTAKERKTTGKLAALVADPAGLELAVRFVDRVARPHDVNVGARELRALGAYTAAARSFLGRLDTTMLSLGTRVAPVAPRLVVPIARGRLRQLVGHLVADAGPGLTKHLAHTRADGFRLNLNLLGEAVLGEEEASRRLERVRRLVERPDVDYVSVKVSAVASQLSTWDQAGSVARVIEKLRPLYRTAQAHGTFLNLDMEEYRDLALTVRVFEELLTDPELTGYEAGIVLQAYLPDAADALAEITTIAQRRRAAGGAGVKVRLVKGANLAMEKVEAELHGWAQAPYPTKPEVDANYVGLLDQALTPDATGAVRIGAASHNLFHVALAHLLAERRGVHDALDIEMLQGMSPAQARAVRDTVGAVLLYVPVVAKKDFDVAISYLVRRLEENAAEQNFLHAAFAGPGTAGAGTTAMDRQEDAFRASVAGRSEPRTTPRRTPQDEPTAPPAGTFANAADTDPAVAASRKWALGLLRPGRAAEAGARIPGPIPIRSIGDVDAAVARAHAVREKWASTAPAERAAILRRAAVHLEEARGDLVATAADEVGKTLAEADPEVSEAVDFAAYYARSAERLDPSANDPLAPEAVFAADGVIVVTPPWNFPIAIPIGGVLAALAAGSPVLIKPAPPAPRTAAVAVEAVHHALREAGVDPDVLQILDSPEGEIGRRLVTHPDVARVVLTGALDTAALFAGWSPRRALFAETSGKNAIVVTPSADVDLAVADVVRSAFGHAGQKCSAASLLILVGSAATDPRIRRQLADATRSLAVGPGTDISTTMGPLTEPAAGKLERALTTLEPGESWLVEPRALDDSGRAWTPGVRWGVRRGSFFHRTECFGPVLGVMTTATLDEAIDLQNDVAFGLTGGIHSLDEAETDRWLDRVRVGNAYVNRHITGAIVQRQSFGGWKASNIGPGAKAGGPNYVQQLGTWADAPSVAGLDDEAWLAAAVESDRTAMAAEFAPEHDPTGLAAEANVFRYRPIDHLTVRAGDDARPVHVRRVVAAAGRAGVPVRVSATPRARDGLVASTPPVAVDAVESDAEFAAAIRAGAVTGRVRVVGSVSDDVYAAAAEHLSLVAGNSHTKPEGSHEPPTQPGERPRAGGLSATSSWEPLTLLDRPVVASGRVELLTVFREQTVSRTLHRFGHVDGAAPRTASPLG